MPYKPLRPCKHTGCPNLTDKGYCEAHKHLAPARLHDKKRPSAYQRGYNRKWQEYREEYLADHRLCVRCYKQGRLTRATVVDHVKPHKGNEQLFWDESNHQALCVTCHSRKTATKDGGFGNEKND